MTNREMFDKIMAETLITEAELLKLKKECAKFNGKPVPIIVQKELDRLQEIYNHQRNELIQCMIGKVRYISGRDNKDEIFSN